MRVYINVGKVQVVNGPGYRHLSSVLSLLANDQDGSRAENGIQTRFMINTGAAHETPIKAIVRICCLKRNSESDYYFSGIFQTQLIEGNYNPTNRSGDMQDL